MPIPYIKVLIERKCLFCGKKYKGRRDQRFCKRKHQVAFNKIVLIPTGLIDGIDKEGVRYISVNLACMDLIKKGFIIFKALHKNNTADLLAYKQDGKKNFKVYKVEIMTCRYNSKSGQIVHPLIKNKECILIGVTLNDSKVHYLNKYE